MMAEQQTHDPLGYVAELQNTLATDVARKLLPTEDSSAPPSQRWQVAEQAALDDRELRAEAVALVEALGFCRLFGTALPDELQDRFRSPLPPELLVPASLGLLDVIETAREEASTLPERFDEAEPIEDRSLCNSVLHLLMDTWASFIVIDEEYQLHLEEVHSLDTPFGNLMRQILDAFDRLDEAVQQDEQIKLLSIATELPLLDNWRKMLVEPYSDVLPWWLDGRLENAAEKVRRAVENDMTFARPGHQPESRSTLVLLARRNEEIEEQLSQLSLAASAGKVSGPVAEELLQTTFAITDEQDVSVRLELQPAEENKRRLSIALVGPSSATKKYVSVEVGLSGGKNPQASFNLGCAMLALSQQEVDRIESLIVVDKSGKRRSVDPECV